MDEVEIIAGIAKALMLRDGYHMPIVFVKGTNSDVAIGLRSFGETNEERVQDLLQVGIKTAVECNVGELELIVLVNEAWMSSNPEVLPSQDPERKEMLMVQSLDARTQDEDMQGFEIIRDPKGQVVSLLDWHHPVSDSVKGNLLQAFQEGYQTVRPILN